jgi:opacity protein-like surface antigen
MGNLKPVLWTFLFMACTGSVLAEERALTWQLDGGYSMSSGTTGDYLENGWIVGGGLSWKPDPGGPFAVLAELHYSRYGATNNLVRLANQQSDTVRIDNGDADIWGLNLNGVYKIPLNERLRGYVTFGIGEYNRTVRLTQTALVAGYFCDPWWGICYESVFPGQVIAQDESTTRFAWNAGAGIEFPLQDGAAFFVEARYHRMSTGDATEFIPLQFGFRF